MAGSSLLALIDDIATLLDDVALMSKVAAKKTAGVLGDDLALNAQQLTGITADRELPVVWAVAKGSFINKLILVPAALIISVIAPWAIIPLLMAGGLFLCFEGFEKLAHRFLHSPSEDEAEHQEKIKALINPAIDLVAFEKTKIKGAVRTDFILSAEIIAITLGTVAAASFTEKVAVLSIIAVVITIGVYGLVAGIVKLDDAGLHLSKAPGESAMARFKRQLGLWLVAAAPKLMHALSIVGTAAMFMVGGGILSHGLPIVAHGFHDIAMSAGNLPVAGILLGPVTPTLLDMLLGIVAGAVTLFIVMSIQRLRGQKQNAH